MLSGDVPATAQAAHRWAERELAHGKYTEQNLAYSAQLLFEEATSISRVQRTVQPNLGLSDAQRARLGCYVKQRMQGMPLQYIVGHTAFYHTDILCEPGVLIPRPETEGLVELTLALLSACATSRGRLHILDLCTGTGCVGIALANELAHAHVDAVDISAKAVDLARKNAKHVGLQDSFHVYQGDVYAPLSKRHYDCIVANPPYIACTDMVVSQEVLDNEPRNALFAGDEGLSVFYRIAYNAPQWLKSGGLFACELASENIEKAAAVLRSDAAQRWHDVTVHLDYAGRKRYLTAFLCSVQKE